MSEMTNSRGRTASVKYENGTIIDIGQVCDTHFFRQSGAMY